MSEFDFWQRWGVDLDDTQFANAWCALGIVFAAGTRQDAPKTVAAKVLKQSRQLGNQAAWAFPQASLSTGRKASISTLLADTKPRDWVEAWVEAVQPLADDERPRLRIASAPSEEPAFVWLRLLDEANPAPIAVSFKITAPRADCQVSWPLKLGFLHGNAAEAVIEAAHKHWPAKDQSQPVALGRRQANCDLVIHSGTTRTLLKALLDHPASIKANVLLLRSEERRDWGELSARLSSLLAEVRGSGFMLIPEVISDDEFAFGLNLFVAAISHAQPFDAAFSGSFGLPSMAAKRLDRIAGFTDEIAAFTLPKLARTINRRIKAMPPGSKLDLSSLGGPDEWLTRGVRGGGQQRGVPKPAAPDANRHVAARSVAIETKDLEFRHESEGGTVLATVGGALETAEVPETVHAKRAARFVQQQSFVRRNGRFEPASNGFVTDVPALVRVRIGPQEETWNTLATEFPVEKLPEHLERWRLTVWFGEPDHLPQPLRSRLYLPRDGASTECEFHFRPKAFPRFEGRVSIVHRGRVIQTAVLRASVLRAFADDAKGDAPSLNDVIPVRQGLGDLNERRQFDLAFVVNCGTDGRPLSTGLSENHAWISDLQQSIEVAKDINARLSPLAKSVADYADGLRGEKGRTLLVQLAQHGCWLHLYLVEQQLGARGNRPDIAEKEYLQIVSTRSDAVVPFEFIYDYQAPNDDAELCQHWQDGVRAGECQKTCDNKSGKFVCPLGFWGIKKVIERHALTPELAREGSQLYLQSEPGRASDTLRLGGIGVFGASQRVPIRSLQPLSTALNNYTGEVPQQAADWDSWAKLVHDNHPRLLIALAHADGKGANVSLELGGKTIKSIQIARDHVWPHDVNQHPLVALLGCDTTGTADDYGQHVAIFRARGAAIVIGTISTVFGDQAAQVARRLIDGLIGKDRATPLRLGEALRTLKREALLDDLIMPLCLVAYGDADWKLTK
jgi:hypothetical protein